MPDLEATELNNAELVQQMECAPDTQAVPLPAGTNQRVTAAVAALTKVLAQSTPTQPRRRDDRVNRYIYTQLSQLRLEQASDPNCLRSLESLRSAFAAELPQSVIESVRRLMREKVEGRQFAAELPRYFQEQAGSIQKARRQIMSETQPE